MEVDQEFNKFVCKLCNKKYPCGKSLGDHMRTHVVEPNSAESEENFEKKVSSLCVDGQQSALHDSKLAEFGNGQQSGYGLRENPKRTWRAVDSTSPLPQERICKQCGKGFQSLKALCGHMACHSEKDKGLKDEHSWTSDSHSDTEEAEDRVIRTRSSKSKRFKKVVVKLPFDHSLAINGSSVSEIDGEEQEEVAMCLMLLSRDSGYKSGIGVNYSVVESSDNNSVVLETKSVSKVEESPKTNSTGDKKLKSAAMDVENSDSEYFLDECAKPESDVSVDWFHRYGALGKFTTRESYSYYYNSDEFGRSLSAAKDLIKESEFDNVPEKRSKYECLNCKKTFKSYQALGGHRPCHKRTYEPRYESGNNSLDDSTEHGGGSKKKPSAKHSSSHNNDNKANKKNKGHVCPFCDRVFKNGQALGGHKRSHFIGGHEEVRHQRPVTKPEILDLNLPAPEQDENDGNGQFLSGFQV